MDLTILVIGIYLIIFSFLMNTKNLLSALIFRILPFFCGLFLIVYFADVMNFINFN